MTGVALGPKARKPSPAPPAARPAPHQLRSSVAVRGGGPLRAAPRRGPPGRLVGLAPLGARVRARPGRRRARRGAGAAAALARPRALSVHAGEGPAWPRKMLREASDVIAFEGGCQRTAKPERARLGGGGAARLRQHAQRRGFRASLGSLAKAEGRAICAGACARAGGGRIYPAPLTSPGRATPATALAAAAGVSRALKQARMAGFPRAPAPLLLALLLAASSRLAAAEDCDDPTPLYDSRATVTYIATWA